MTSPVSTIFPTTPKDNTTHPYGERLISSRLNHSTHRSPAIKTSSSSILTRTNSLSNTSTHSYTPPVPISPKTSKSRYVPRKHTYSSPTKEMGPPPVPIPSFMTGIVSDGEGVPPTPPLTVRVKRRESLPALSHGRSDSEIELSQLPVSLLSNILLNVTNILL